MADSKKLIPFLLKWEGGFVDDPLDKGGATMKGVTIGTFRQFCGQHMTASDLKAITDEQWNRIFKTGYWDRWRADEIRHQSIANILVDWIWGSGIHAVRIPQRLLGVTDDGIVGPVTLAAVNAATPSELFYEIKGARKLFIHDIIAGTPTNIRFRQGWLNRLNDLKFEL